MDNMMNLWTLIVKSNTFNFALFMLIIILVAKKIDVSGMMLKLQQGIQTKLDNAKAAKSTALEDLKAAETSIENLSEDIAKMLGDAKNTAKILESKILEDAKKQVENIENNAKKVIEAEEKTLVSELTHSAALKSVEMAFGHIKNALNNNPSLHDKYINESIDNLEKMDL